MADESRDGQTSENSSILEEERKRKGFFKSWNKLRRRSRTKAKSMTELRATKNSREARSTSMTKNGAVAVSHRERLDRIVTANDESSCNSSPNSDGSGLDEVENGEVAIDETDLFADLPPGSTAAMVWRSGTCSFFAVEIKVIEGRHLIARDRTGTSDPYVKVKLHGKCVFKSKIIFKNLDPTWNESFPLAIDDVNTNLLFRVYDFDRIGSDDDMGMAQVDLGPLEVNVENNLILNLSNDNGLHEELGQLVVSITINPKTPNERQDFARLMTNRKSGSRPSHARLQQWDGIVSVLLSEGKKLNPMDDNGLSDPYCRFKLGNEKYKTKCCKQTLDPQWNEQFDLKFYSDTPNTLEITVWDRDPGKDEFMGRCNLNLSDLQHEKSHYIEAPLEDRAGFVCLRLSITGLAPPGCASDLNTKIFNPSDRIETENKFSLLQTAKNMKVIGWLQVKLHRAVGLAVADLSGASDPFAVFELNNQRLVTSTIYKTLNPQWEKFYELEVFDIHDTLNITIYDEDRRGAPEFLGRVSIPLLSITPREKHLFQLKDKRLERQAKGHLVITFDLIYNKVRAGVRTFNPREPHLLYEPPRFRRQLLQRNIDRFTSIAKSIVATGQYVQSLFTWKHRLRSGFAFVVYILLVLNFELYFIPLGLMVILLKNYIHFTLAERQHLAEEGFDGFYDEEDDDDDDEDDTNKRKGAKSKSFRERLEAVNKICTTVQNALDSIASFGERIKNTFNWSAPFCSYLLLVILLAITILLYLIPLRYLLLLWGVNKFTKKIRKPNAIPNNELMDFLSRVPSDPELKHQKQLKADILLR